MKPYPPAIDGLAVNHDDGVVSIRIDRRGRDPVFGGR